MSNKKVFISYSWSIPAIEDWVLDLAHRLVNDGIMVVLDKWDLKPGQDKFAFMESMVQADDIDKVLIILDKTYVKKANDREGGVGTETIIISAKVYESTSQTKFIPIVAELDEAGNVPLPTYLSGKIYIDFSTLERIEESYEKLLRDIYQRPSTSRPSLGVPPSYLFEDTPITYKTSILLRAFDQRYDKRPTQLNLLIRDFLDAFLDNIKDFKFQSTGPTYYDLGQKIVNVLNQYIPLRNDYITFIDKVCKLGDSFDEAIFITFFERLGNMTGAQMESENGQDFESYKFFLHELFLYTIGVALKREHYKLLEELFYTKYFFSEYYRSESKAKSFEVFYFHSEAIEQYYKKFHGKQFFSSQADLLITRMSEHLTRDSFVEADLICYYISSKNSRDWYPITYPYRNEHSSFFNFFSKLISLRHFEKVKGVLGVGTIDELKKMIEAGDLIEERGYSGAFRKPEKISNWIEIKDIGTTR